MAEALAAGVGGYANEVRSKQIAFSQAKDVWSQQSAMADYQNATRNLYERINDFSTRENSFLAASVGSRSIAQTDVGYIFNAYQTPVSQIINQVNTPLAPNHQVGQQVPGTSIPGSIGVQNGQPVVLDPRLQNGRGVGVAANTTYVPQVVIPQAGQLPTQIPTMTSPTGVQYMMVPTQNQSVYGAGSTMWPTTTPISTLNTTTFSPLSTTTTTTNGANLNGRINGGRF